VPRSSSSANDRQAIKRWPTLYCGQQQANQDSDDGVSILIVDRDYAGPGITGSVWRFESLQVCETLALSEVEFRWSNTAITEPCKR